MPNKRFRRKAAVSEKKAYAVRNGKDNFSGVVFDWESCKKLTEGVQGAKMKSFSSITAAKAFALGEEGDKVTATENHKTEKNVKKRLNPNEFDREAQLKKYKDYPSQSVSLFPQYKVNWEKDEKYRFFLIVEIIPNETPGKPPQGCFCAWDDKAGKNATLSKKFPWDSPSLVRVGVFGLLQILSHCSATDSEKEKNKPTPIEVTIFDPEIFDYVKEIISGGRKSFGQWIKKFNNLCTHKRTPFCIVYDSEISRTSFRPSETKE